MENIAKQTRAISVHRYIDAATIVESYYLNDKLMFKQTLAFQDNVEFHDICLSVVLLILKNKFP